MTDALFTGGLIAYLAGAVASLGAWRRPSVARFAGCALALAGALLEALASVGAIARGAARVWALPFGVPLFSLGSTLGRAECRTLLRYQAPLPRSERSLQL